MHHIASPREQQGVCIKSQLSVIHELLLDIALSSTTFKLYFAGLEKDFCW
jgi:hypothetical protein